MLEKRFVCISVLLFMAMCGCQSQGWKGQFQSVLPEYGHRNWIVVADSAYPMQSAPGIKTIYTGKTQIEVLDTVLNAIAEAPHVQAVAMLDAELDSVTEADAPGVKAYREALKNVLQGKEVKEMPHEDIIAELDKGAEMFNILVLKTDMTIPYTSVFLQLDCGYWGAEEEARLRAAMTE